MTSGVSAHTALKIMNAWNARFISFTEFCFANSFDPGSE